MSNKISFGGGGGGGGGVKMVSIVGTNRQRMRATLARQMHGSMLS